MTTGRRIAYIRTSPGDSPDALHQLAWVEADLTFNDEGVGPRSTGRPQRRAAFSALRAGDTLVVQSLNRLARTRDELAMLLRELARLGVAVEFVREAVTLSPRSPEEADREIALVLAGVQWQLDTYAELQGVGINRAVKVKRRYTGRPMKLSPTNAEEMVRRFHALADTPGDTAAKIAAHFDVSRETLYRYVRAGEKLLEAAAALKRAKGQTYRANAATKLGSTDAERLHKKSLTTERHGIALRREAFAHAKGVSLAEAVAATQPEAITQAQAAADAAKLAGRKAWLKKREDARAAERQRAAVVAAQLGHSQPEPEREDEPG